MIKKHLIFHSFFLSVIGVWIILILNVVLNAYSISFLTSPSISPFGGIFGVFYWVIVGVSAASSFVLGLDKLGLGQVIWKRVSSKEQGRCKSEVVVAPKKSKPKTSKGKSVGKKKVIGNQKKVAAVVANVDITTNQNDQNRKKDQMKSFYLFGETEFNKCQHVFGYLGDTLKNKPIPDECFGCPKLLECFKPTKKSKNKKHELTTVL